LETARQGAFEAGEEATRMVAGQRTENEGAFLWR